MSAESTPTGFEGPHPQQLPDAEEWIANRRRQLIAERGHKMMRGNLAETSLVELFENLDELGSEGTLRVWNLLEERYLYFRDGTVQIFVPQRRNKRLGERLVHFGRLAPDKLVAAIRAQKEDYRPLGMILVEEGYVTQAEIDEVVDYQAQEDLLSLFTWPRGNFEFFGATGTDAEMEARLEVLPCFGCEDILAEADRRAAEWDTILATIGSVDETFIARSMVDPHELGNDQFQVLSSLDGSRSVRDLVDVTLYSMFDCARLVKDLCDAEMIDRATVEQTLSAADEWHAAGESRRAVRMLQTQLARDDRDVDTVVAIADRLELYGEPKIASEALLRATELIDDGERAVDLARRACDLDHHSSRALSRLRALLAGARMGAEYTEVSLHLVDALADEGYFDDALATISELESRHARDVDVLNRKARILHRLGLVGEAITCLTTIAEIVEAKAEEEPAGGPARTQLTSIYEQILALDPRSKGIATKLQELENHYRRFQPRTITLAASIAVALAVLLGGVPLYLSHRATEIESAISERVTSKIVTGDIAGARTIIDKAMAEHGQTEHLMELQARIGEVVTRRQTKDSRDLENEVRTEIAQTRELMASGKLWTALQRFERLMETRYGKSRVPDEVTLSIQQVSARLEKAAAELQPITAEPKNVLDAMELRKLAAAEMKDPARAEELRLAKSALELQGDDVFEELVDLEQRTRLLAIAAKVVEAIEIAEEKNREFQAITNLDPLLEAATRHEKNFDFRAALTAYQRLIDEHPGSGATKDHFRQRAKVCSEIIYYLDTLERATESGNASVALATLKSLENTHPDVPFDEFVEIPLRVESTPGGASVLLNGEDVGKTPLLTSYVPDGDIRVELRLPGFAPRDLTFEPRTGSRVVVELVKKPDWTFESKGAVEARPTTDGEGVAYLADRSGRLTALDLETGRKRWEFVSGDLSGLLPSPVTYGNDVIVASIDGTLRSLHRDSGELRWNRQNLQCEAAPVLFRGTLVLGLSNGDLVGLRAGSGDEKYRVKLPGPVSADLRITGNRVVLITANGMLACHRATDGSENWRVRVGQTAAIAPCLGGGVVAGVSDEGNVIAVSLIDGSVLWRRTLNEVIVSPTVIGSRLIVADGEYLRSYGLRDGRAGPSYEGSAVWSSDLVARDNTLFAGNRDGECVLLNSEQLTKRYKIVGTGPATAPVLVDGEGRVVVSFEGRQVQGFSHLP